MVEAVNELLLRNAGAAWVIPAMFLFAAFDGILPPIPSESALIGLAAVGGSTGEPNWLALGLAAAAGAWIGDNGAYLLGRHGHLDRFMERTDRRQRAMEWASTQLDRKSAVIIVVGRYVPIGRVAVNLTAGASHYPRRRFSLLTAFSAVMWASWSVALGTFAGSWVQDNPLLAAALGIGLALVVGLLIERFVSRATRTDAA
ncbi:MULTISPECIES: DedA family protein [unclassified Knoellia]|uniref:DedA family protein n=1 Tax=Knoellia altitudinis TaxID=3404795 RepID=UPI003610203A